MSSRVALAWYYHLPSIATRIEVRDHAHRSLALLLRIHQECRKPVLIAATGSFLSLCHRDAQDAIDDLLDMYRSGLAEPATTCFHEVDPFSIPWKHLREQIRRDHYYKAELVGRSPVWFFAPNFAWHPAMDRLLAELEIRGAILDSRHLATSATARAWRWSSDAYGEVVTADTPAFVSPWEHRRLRALAVGSEGNLRLVFRDWPLTRALTFGNDSEIHKPDPDVHTHLAECNSDDLIVLADDGDRIGPASRRGYEELLRVAHTTLDWQALADEGSPLPSVRELPAFSQPGFDQLLRTSLEARTYWSLLNQIAAQSLNASQLSRLLALQDVFYPFWKGIGRRRWYLDTAIELLEEVQQQDGCEAITHLGSRAPLT